MLAVSKNNSHEPIGSKILVGVAIAILAATFGYVVSYLDQHRKDQIAFVNAQIEKLYGPLFAMVQTNDIAWRHFRQIYWSERASFFAKNHELNQEDIDLWRRWIRNVFQPINVKMEDAIVNNAQLLVGEHMPQVFLQFISHTEAYKSVIAKWEDEEKEEKQEMSPTLDISYLAKANMSPIVFPPQPAFTNCIVEQFRILKTLQQQLQAQLIGWFQPLKEKIALECVNQ
jgi:hypothetical protein